jgi:hypothetical protein
MDVWRTRDQRLVARLWSRCQEVDDYSVQIVGFSGPRKGSRSAPSCGERWIPECLRDEYESWITSEIPFIFSGPAWSMFLTPSRDKMPGRMIRRSIDNAHEIIEAKSARIQSLL